MKVAAFSERLNEALTLRNMKAADLARITGVPEASISCYKRGQYEAKQNRVYEFAHALRVNPTWLMGYDVPMESDLASSIPPGFQPLPEMSSVPRVGRIACGTPILAEENIETRDSVPAAWRADFTLLCEGDSMEPKIKDGDLVAIRTQEEVENGEIAAVRIDCEATLKRVFLFPDHIELRAENPSFPTIIRIGEAMNDVHIEGKAVGLCREI